MTEHHAPDDITTRREQLIEAMSAVSEDRTCMGWSSDWARTLHAEGGIWETLGRAVGWPTGNYDQWEWVSWDEAARSYGHETGAVSYLPPDQTAHACDNCSGIDPDSCLFNPDRPSGAAAAVSPPPDRAATLTDTERNVLRSALDMAEEEMLALGDDEDQLEALNALRHLAAEAQQPDAETRACVHPDGCDGECPCPPSCGCCTVTAAQQPEAEPTSEQIVGDHVTTLHLIGEQLANVETWMWEHLADVRAASAAADAAPEPGRV